MTLPYFPLYPSDFDADTGHLSLAEDGAYNRLLRLSWRCPDAKMPDDLDWICRKARISTDADRAIVATILDEFFTRKGGKIFNARLHREWIAARDAHKGRVLAGKRGGSAKALKNKENTSSNAKAMPEQCSSNQNQNQNHKEREADASPKKAAGRLPEDWKLPKPWGDWAVAEGLPAGDVRREADKFRDYWIAAPAAKAVKTDWQAVWRNWVRKAVDDRRKGQPPAAVPEIHGAFGRIREVG